MQVALSCDKSANDKLQQASFIVNPDVVWKPGELQSVYNELSFYVELASPCTNLLKFCLLIFQ